MTQKHALSSSELRNIVDDLSAKNNETKNA